ncbi:SpaA isopeptide-forming pilin-related protein [Enterococcus faecium]|uniref:SpaA isopeptide-forming pilin-related protein n=1 Tax=Enterococcus faecium TaxID=1352 RepID=UPI002157F0F5|nr:SpaA isopeptide-forming pilin-related protein [Enterococcus faecium]
MKFKGFKKVKKKMASLMLFLSLSGAISQPIGVLAETEAFNQTESSEVVKTEPQNERIETPETSDSTQEETPVVEESQKVEEEKVVSSEQIQEQKVTEPTEVTQEQVLVPAPAKTQEQLTEEIKALFAQNGYEWLEDGNVRSTTGTSYRSDLYDVLRQAEALKAQNQAQTRANLFGGDSFLPKGTGVVYVDSNYGDANFRWKQTGIPQETGYYAKRDASGNPLWCVEPGAPLDWGANPGFTTSNVTDDKYIKASLAVYWGWEKQKSIVNSFYTEKLVQEITTGKRVESMSDLSGQGRVSLSGYEVFRKETLAKVDTFFKRPSFNGKSYTVQAGETLTLTDTNKVLSYYELEENNANVSTSISGNTLKITPKTDSKDSGSLKFFYKIDPSYKGATILYQAPWLQDVIKARIGDPAESTVNIKVQKEGEFQIKKVDKETGKPVPGTKFKLEYSNIPAGMTAPKVTEVTTDENGLSPKIKAPHGTHVKATEISVPDPYVLGSTVGDSDVVEGDVVSNELIVLTQRNQQAKGQIIIEKSGVESGKDMWNANYTLAGNVFEVRKDTVNGEVVKTITTDDKGHAETGKDLPLGTYAVVEKTASNGFANTFKPVIVKIEYANQTTAVIVKNTEGTNQEVTGSTVLTKEDAETGSETQGQATFNGAQYGLFHEDGTPVKWSETFKPEYVEGKKLEGDEIVFEMTDELPKASVKHLALGKYFWRETKAPEGYQIDNTKREFEITYKDQNTKVIATESVSKENVVKFSLDGFKYVESKSGGTKTGYNGIEFKLTPINGTKGEEISTETVTDENGYDGYFAFEGVPYGDYDLEEVKAPEGYQIIQPLTITSDFDAEKREYTFTVTEKDQKEPLKVLTVSEEEINNGSNVIQLSKLFITNNLVKIPTIRTLATVDGEKTFTPAKDTPMHDDIFLGDLNKGDKYTNKIKLWRIQNENYEKAQVVFETDKDFVAQAENEKQVIDTLVDTSKDDENTSYVWTEELYDETGKKVAEHNDLTNKDQTVTPKIEKKEVVPTTSEKQTPTSTPKQPQAKQTQNLPKTGEFVNPALVVLGMVLFVSALIVLAYRSMKEEN